MKLHDITLTLVCVVLLCVTWDPNTELSMEVSCIERTLRSLASQEFSLQSLGFTWPQEVFQLLFSKAETIKRAAILLWGSRAEQMSTVGLPAGQDLANRVTINVFKLKWLKLIYSHTLNPGIQLIDGKTQTQKDFLNKAVGGPFQHPYFVEKGSIYCESNCLKVKALTLRLEERGISEPCFKDRRIWESHIAGGSGMQLLGEGVLHGSGLDRHLIWTASCFIPLHK